VLVVGYGLLYLVVGIAFGEFSRDGAGLRFLRSEPMTSVDLAGLDCRDRTDPGGRSWKGGWWHAEYVRTCDEDSLERRREAVALLAREAVRNGWQEVPDPIRSQPAEGAEVDLEGDEADAGAEPSSLYFAKAVVGETRPALLRLSSQSGTYTSPGFMLTITASSSLDPLP
jgi:hypothetical protein